MVDKSMSRMGLACLFRLPQGRTTLPTKQNPCLVRINYVMDARWIANACVAGVLSFAPLAVAYAQSLKPAAPAEVPTDEAEDAVADRKSVV